MVQDDCNLLSANWNSYNVLQCMQPDVAWFGVVVTDTAGPGGALCMRLPYAGMCVCGRRAMVCSCVLGAIHEVDPSVCVLLK